MRRRAFDFDDADFRFSHGQSPRGFGCWAFSMKRHPDVMSDDVVWTPSMTFTDAKVWAKAAFRARGANGGTVFVMS